LQQRVFCDHCIDGRYQLIPERLEGLSQVRGFLKRRLRNMTSKQTDTSIHIANVGKEQMDGMNRIQKEMIETYEEAGRVWTERMKAEMDLWSGLGARLAGTHSLPEAMETYQKYVTQRVQMAAEDARQLFEQSQKITRSLSNRFSPASS
jgi:hypothetical protein